MKLFCSNKSIITLIGIILSVFSISGCANKQISQDEIILRAGVINPVPIGRWYIENIFKPEKKEKLYELFSQQSQELLDFKEFSQRIDELSALIDTKNAFISVIPLNLFIFSNDRMVVYYLMVYENDFAGVYSVTELFFVQEIGLWKIDIQNDGTAVSALPVIRKGDIIQLNRKELQFINDDIDKRIAMFKQEYQQPAPIVPVLQTIEREQIKEQESLEEQTNRTVKKEMIVGKTYFDVGDYDRASVSFERVLALQPDNIEAQRLLKKTLTAIQKKEAELKEAELKAQEEKARQQIVPEPAPIKEDVKQEPVFIEKSVEDQLFDNFFESGKKAYDAGDYRKAIIQFQKAVSIKPDDVSAKLFIEKCEKAIQIVPSN